MYDIAMTNGHSARGSSGIIPGRLANLLRQKGISAAELARRTGIDKSTISLILNGKRKAVSSDNALKIADEFNVSVDYLIGNAATPEPTPLMLGELLVELTQVARHLSLRQQRDLLALARTYMEQNEEARQVGKARLMEELLSLVREYGGEVSEERLIDLLDMSSTGDTTGGIADDTDVFGVAPDDEKEPPQGDE